MNYIYPNTLFVSSGKFYYLKKWAFYLLLLLNARRGKHHARKEKEDQSDKAETQSSRKQRGYGMTIADPDDLEACNKLEDHPDVRYPASLLNFFCAQLDWA